MKRRYKYILFSVVVICIVAIIISRIRINHEKSEFYYKKVKISNIKCTIDKDKDGINDPAEYIAIISDRRDIMAIYHTQLWT